MLSLLIISINYQADKDKSFFFVGLALFLSTYAGKHTLYTKTGKKAFIV